ncbi:SpoIID/LytB domain-containing protein [Prochlorococcus sp. MIT 0603]|uniref:SpoIID/LytB domain-containing protein n=1 Tax=Prochlorococcus sp. MIT 0603 TaxID=1499500 RepID=UPI00068D8D35|nr:SpoIID/LytB domain-containing protein [Prochlorococcus sp. MIT 0603]
MILFNGKTLATREPIIRVLVNESKEIYIRADTSRPILVAGINSSRIKVKSLRLRIVKGQIKYSINGGTSKPINRSNNQQIIIRTRDPRGMWLGKRRYSGQLRLLNKGKSIKVVNHLPLEKYLKSVVGSEVPKEWPLETLKAQSIASRTYALNQLNKNIDYDLASNISNQVYLGLEAESPRVNQAVNSTKSLVMLHKGKLIDAVFHSSSGGKTESSTSVWGKYRPYLRSVNSFDKESPANRWEKKIDAKQLKNLYLSLGGINTIRVLNRTDTKRISTVKLYGPKGTKVISGKEIRQLLGLKSSLANFKMLPSRVNASYENAKDPYLYLKTIDTKITKKNPSLKPVSNINYIPLIPLPKISRNQYLLIKGSGAGHGVGMSQWGAKKMAEDGYSHRKILYHFYKNIYIRPFT